MKDINFNYSLIQIFLHVIMFMLQPNHMKRFAVISGERFFFKEKSILAWNFVLVRFYVVFELDTSDCSPQKKTQQFCVKSSSLICLLLFLHFSFSRQDL